MAALLLTVGGVMSFKQDSRNHPQPLMAAADVARAVSDREPASDANAATQQYLSKDIRDLQVFQNRVLANNPLGEETESPLGEINPAEWRIVRLEHTEPNGTRHIIERGMPLDELTTVTERPERAVSAVDIDPHWQPGDPLPELFDESGFPIDPSLVAAAMDNGSAENDIVETPLVVGSTVEVDLPEHGFSGLFTVSHILPCPTPNPGDGCLVTTKFIHENAEILDIRIEGSAEAIGTTASHPFWSEDRQEFVPAGELRIGESLLLADATPRRISHPPRILRDGLQHRGGWRTCLLRRRRRRAGA